MPRSRRSRGAVFAPAYPPPLLALVTSRPLAPWLPSVRVRAGKILGELWSHPLGEPRQAILDLVRASTATEVPATAPAELAAGTADVSTSGGGSGGSVGSTSGGTVVGRTIPDKFLATEFFKSAFDTITYFFNDALDRLR